MKQDKAEKIRAKKIKVNKKLDETSAYKKDKKNTVTGKKSNPKFEKLMDKDEKLSGKLKEAKAKSKADPKLEQKSKQRVEKDYARNAIHDYETGHKSEANYEKKKELEVAAGEMHGYFASASKVHKHGKGRS